MRWVVYVVLMGERKVVYRALGRKPEGQKPLGRPRRRSEDNIKMDFQDFFLILMVGTLIIYH